jgi:hypothetical protein
MRAQRYDDMAGPIAFASGLSTPSFFARNGPTWAYYRQGLKELDCDEIRTNGLRISPDGRHWAYAAKRGAHWFVICDGEPGPGYDEIVSEVGFSGSPLILEYVVASRGELMQVREDLTAER